MAKKKGGSKSNTSKSSSSKQQPTNASSLVPSLNSQANANVSTSSPSSSHHAQHQRPLTWREIFFLDRNGYHVLIIVISLGTLFGFLAGAGVIFPHNAEPSPDHPQGRYAASFFGLLAAAMNGHRNFLLTTEGIIVDTPDNPRYFAVLREAVVREKGGYVHPDLGMLYPAPSGAVRGLGMIRENFGHCQATCFPGTDHERAIQRRDLIAGNYTWPTDHTFAQEDVLIRVPLKFQMTRAVAIDTLSAKFSADTRTKFLELDDAAMLVLLLAHEKNVGRYSRWLPYIASLPPQPTCGYFRSNQQPMLDAIAVYREQLGVDTQGWEGELLKATAYSESMVDALTNDFGSVLAKPTPDTSQKDSKKKEKKSTVSKSNLTIKDTIAWALCQVASRATAGNEKHGSLRLVPIVDMINHHLSAGGFLELTGKERIDNGDPMNASEDDAGTFIVRSLRHGRWKPLKLGQELLVNYNVPQYSALDWLVSLGFVPEERWDPWIKLDPALPPLRRDGPGQQPSQQQRVPTEQLLRERDEQVLAKLQALDL